MQERSSQACNLGQTFEFGLAMEPATLTVIGKRKNLLVETKIKL